MNSRQKGSRGERELAKIFREHGYEARRGQQYCGASGDADVIGLPGIHVECKRVEKLNLLDAMEQAVRDYAEEVRSGAFPTPAHSFSMDKEERARLEDRLRETE